LQERRAASPMGLVLGKLFYQCNFLLLQFHFPARNVASLSLLQQLFTNLADGSAERGHFHA
jgi:hypothetical protein